MAKPVIIAGSAENIRNVLDAATPEQRAIGVQWYDVFRADIIRTAQRAGMTVRSDRNPAANPSKAIRMLCGIAAAFSIQRSPNVNLCHLFDFVRCHMLATQPHHRDNYHSPIQDAKARAMANGADPIDVLTGPKERAFYLNIIGDPDHVTIDGHAYSIWLGERITTDKIKVPKSGHANRLACEEDYRSVAAEYNLNPAQVQAITWVVWRDQHQTQSDKARLMYGGDHATNA
jgi:hypothetical protein